MWCPILDLTEEKLAANRRNQGLPHGPATAEGRERRVVRAKVPRGSANLLRKMKRREGKTEVSESLEAIAEDFVCHDIIQNKGT